MTVRHGRLRAFRAPNSRTRTTRVACLAFALLTLIVAAGACSSSSPTSSPASPAKNTASDSALLSRLTVEGSEEAFARRYLGDIAGDGSELVFAGIRGRRMVVYVCDETMGEWFTGTVAADGGGTLQSVGGDGSVVVTSAGPSLHVRFDGGDFEGRNATLARARPSEAKLIRLVGDRATGGPDAATAGVILTPTALRGHMTVSVDKWSADTISLLGPPSSDSTPTSATTSAVEGNAAGSSAAAAPSAAFSVSVLNSTPPGNTSPAQCAAYAGMLKSLTSMVQNLTTTLSQLRQLQTTLTAQLGTTTGSKHTAVQEELDQANADISNTEQSIQAVQAQIATVQAKLQTCPATAP